ncbi:bifunctional riboflavin kinase/FAD synthetase [Chlamydia caviae]|uniref:Riboflavin biosynthesis protein n=1 Tax=Chlamydia caviae (strain ATCC VR-813 / DSM 19441 / 03DC25 / GPIC) TaxID=227941 RepID=Q823F4_CHLCV|nr:bifunctional riboflavin kinase/FAD synthetase [Chlamydia caviae]AAP05208.1 riboflavin biosynthesis protein RibF [Chlamydia caviae GPIC]
MEILYSLATVPSSVDSITIGFFDGCHLGHKQLLTVLSSYSGTSGIITFDLHPRSILQPSLPKLITSTRERFLLLQDFQIDYLYILPFSKSFADQSAESFILSLHQILKCKRLILGYDSKLGKDGQGDAVTLKPLADSLGIEIIEVPPYKIDNEIVSSKRIRQFLIQGDLDSANRHLGHSYKYVGKIETGYGLGIQLGVATINLPQEQCLLPYGVYACEIEHNSITYQGIMNLGEAPTVGRNSLCLEAHLFDFSGNLYGETVSVIPRKFLREEKKFPSREDLSKAIRKDIAEAKAFFTTNYARKA